MAKIRPIWAKKSHICNSLKILEKGGHLSDDFSAFFFC